MIKVHGFISKPKITANNSLFASFCRLFLGVYALTYTVFDLITAPALITALIDFLLYFHLLSPT